MCRSTFGTFSVLLLNGRSSVCDVKEARGGMFIAYFIAPRATPKERTADHCPVSYFYKGSLTQIDELFNIIASNKYEYVNDDGAE